MRASRLLMICFTIIQACFHMDHKLYSISYGICIGDHKLKTKKVFGPERFEKFVQKDIDLEEFAIEMAKTRGWTENGFREEPGQLNADVNEDDSMDHLCVKYKN